VGAWLLRRLRALGWLRTDAWIPCDALEKRCPPAFRGPCRHLVALAVFGPPGQGLSSRDKHRDGLFQQLCAEIMRSAVDTESLRAVANRALQHPEVAGDALLNDMLRTFIAQREAALRAARATPADEHREKEHASKLRHAFSGQAGPHFPTKREILSTFSRFQSEFDAAVAQFDELRAAQALQRMRDLRRRFPVHVPTADLQQAEEAHDRFLRRAGQYRRQICDLARQAEEAARTGDQERSSWVVRRLQAIHSLLPTLLTADKLETLLREIDASEHAHETEEVTRELMACEAAVAREIKELAGVIHRFHQLAARGVPEDPAYRRAKANYDQAVSRIRALDTDWLASLILQLEALIEDLDDPNDDMQSQLDQFIMRVRSALNRLRVEIRTVQSRNGGARRVDPPSN
jgi:hypothetical protein